MIISVDTDQIKKLAEDAKGIYTTLEAEQALIKLLSMQKKIEEGIEIAKKNLEEAGLKINPNFKSIRSSNVRIYYRGYGSRYFIDEQYVGNVPPDLFETTAEIEIPDSIRIKPIDEIHGYLLAIGQKVTKSKKGDGEALNIKRNINSKAVDSFLSEKGGLPVGIVEAPQKKTISVKLKGDEEVDL